MKKVAHGVKTGKELIDVMELPSVIIYHNNAIIERPRRQRYFTDPDRPVFYEIRKILNVFIEKHSYIHDTSIMETISKQTERKKNSLIKAIKYENSLNKWIIYPLFVALCIFIYKMIVKR